MTLWKALTLALVVSGLLACRAGADTVYMVGGGSYKGKVREEGERVIVEIPSGSITLERDRVLRIVKGDDPFVALAERRSQLGGRDGSGHYRLGLWALSSDLGKPARELFEQTVKIQPAHAGANLALGRLFVDDAWGPVDDLLERLKRWSAQGMDSAVLLLARQTLAGSLTPTEQRAALLLAATAARRLGQLSQAQADWQRLALIVPAAEPLHHKATVIAEILAEHPAGLYLVQAGELTRSLAGPDPAGWTHSGFYSLGDDAVLDEALRDRAKAVILQGQARMADAKTLWVTDPTKALAGFRQAEEALAKAEAIKPDIARSYLVEIRRSMIRIYQANAEAKATRFDALMQQLGGLVKAKAPYQKQAQQMLGVLDEIDGPLRQALQLAAPYREDLVIVIATIHEDLATVKALRQMLKDLMEP